MDFVGLGEWDWFGEGIVAILIWKEQERSCMVWVRVGWGGGGDGGGGEVDEEAEW